MKAILMNTEIHVHVRVGWRNRAVVLAQAAITITMGCERPKIDPVDTKLETNNDPDVFTLPHPEQFPVVEVELRKVTDELRVNGVIAPDVNRSVPVVSLGGGRVVEIKAKLGDSVKKGQTLLLINSPDLSQAFSDYQKFQADEQLAAKQLARACEQQRDQKAIDEPVSREKAASTHSEGRSCTLRRMRSCHQLEISRKSSML